MLVIRYKYLFQLWVYGKLYVEGYYCHFYVFFVFELEISTNISTFCPTPLEHSISILEYFLGVISIWGGGVDSSPKIIINLL